MAQDRQQALEARGLLARTNPGRHLGAALLFVLGAAVAGCGGCGGCSCSPDRDRWEAPDDPVAEPSDRFESSAVLAAETSRLAASKRRATTLRVHMASDPGHLNPVASPTVWTRRVVMGTVFETLIDYQPPDGGAGNGPGRYRPGLAASWTIAPGGREVRLELAEASFHDGKALSSVDVQFTLDALRHPNGPVPEYVRMLADIEGVDLVTARALRVRLRKPNGYVLRALAEIPILPAHVYDRRLRSTRLAPVGTGPYRLAERDDHLIALDRWDGYRGPAPAIPRVEFVYEPDAAQALIAAKRGALDIIPALIAAHYPEQTSAPGIAARFEPLELAPPALDYVVMDVADAPLSDARVRRAITLLIDRKALAQDVYDGLRRPVAGPVWPGGPGDGPAPAPPTYQPGEAYRLLDAAGWRDVDGDGRRERHGQPLRVALLADESDDPTRAQLIDHLKRAGFALDVRVGTPAVLRNRLEAHEFDLALVSWRGVVDDDLAPLLGTGGTLNYGRFSEPRVDRALAALEGAWEPAERAARAGELAAAIAEAWPIAPVTSPFPRGLIHRRVRGAVTWNGWISIPALSLDDTRE